MGEKSCLVDDLRTAVYETRTYGGVRGAPHQLRLVGPSTRLWLSDFLSVHKFSFWLRNFPTHF